MSHLVFNNTKEEINRVLRLIQSTTSTQAAPTAATPASFGISFNPTPGTTPSHNYTAIVVYPFLCDSSGTLVTDSEGFLSQTPITVLAPA